MDSFTWSCQCWPTSKILRTTALHRQRSTLEDLQEAMFDRDGWMERERERERERGERELGKSMLAVRPADTYIYIGFGIK